MEHLPIHINVNRFKSSSSYYLLFIPAVVFIFFLLGFIVIYQNFKQPLSLMGQTVLGEQTRTSAP